MHRLRGEFVTVATFWTGVDASLTTCQTRRRWEFWRAVNFWGRLSATVRPPHRFTPGRAFRGWGSRLQLLTFNERKPFDEQSPRPRFPRPVTDLSGRLFQLLLFLFVHVEEGRATVTSSSQRRFADSNYYFWNETDRLCLKLFWSSTY